jgi:type II secretory pathway pseudopilin PulG
MERPTALGRKGSSQVEKMLRKASSTRDQIHFVISPKQSQPTSAGYTLIILLFALTVLTLGLMVAVPVWETQIQREKEEELIFRGKQYIEAIRLLRLKKPGTLPQSLEELLEENCIRRLYSDPMTKTGEWNIVLPYQNSTAGQKSTSQKVLVVPLNQLEAIDNPQIIGVVSSSTKKSFKIYLEQESYDRWIFVQGVTAENMPEIVLFGQEESER